MSQGQLPRSFAEYKSTAAKWITLSNGDYYPDILQFACELYKPVLVMFGQLLATSESSVTLLKQINAVPGWMHIQLCRVFKRYVSPQISVEMLKVKKNIDEICRDFGPNFRPIQEVQAAYMSRPIPDEAICALMYDSDRGGAQEDDRTGGYRHCADEVLQFARQNNLTTKVLLSMMALDFCWDRCGKITLVWRKAGQEKSS